MRGNDWYRPSDDTFLLAESLENASGGSVLEVGTGSGYICELLKRRFGNVVATDINMEALRQAKSRSRDIEFVCCDSSKAISKIQFDLIVMNPPYIPSDGIPDIAVDGGMDGIEVALRMVSDSLPLLGTGGRMLIVTSSLANHSKLIKKVGEMGLSIRIICSKKLAFEEIMVLEACLTPCAARQHQSP